MLFIVVTEMLREMQEENKKLSEDFKRRGEKIEEENSVKKNRQESCVYPQK